MRTKKQAIWRINILYTIFFVAIVASLVLSFASDESQAAFRDGYNQGRAIGMPVTKSITYGLKNKTSLTGFTVTLPTKPSAGEVTALARVSKFEVELSGQTVSRVTPWWNGFVIFLYTSCYITVFIMLFIILSSLRSSVRRGDVFAKRNIKRIRAIGILLICSSLLSSFAMWVESTAMNKVLAADPSTGFVIDTAFYFSGTELITAILILFIGEIFAVGHYLTEEQKLTI